MDYLITKCCDIKNYIIGPKHYFYKTALFFTAGILYSDEFLIGVKMGTLVTITMLPIFSLFLYYLSPLVKQDTIDHIDDCLTKPFVGAIIAPIMEELLFRAGLQTAIKYCIQSKTSVIHVILTALIFGLAHLSNTHDVTKFQAIASSITGIGFGLLFEYYGIWASIGGHTINNTILISIQLMLPMIKKSLENSISKLETK